jgi:methionyl-tRNA formyltransferase
MRLAFLTADEPIYLPGFFERVLDEVSGYTDCVYLVPPLYKGQSSRAAAWRYYRTFGAAAVVSLVRQLIRAKISRTAIARVCERHRVPHAVARDVNAPEFVSRLASGGLDVIISVSCPQIFKKPLLDAAAVGCLNVHGALLPRYRGVMPSFWMLANGEREAGVTVYFMNEEIDAGEVAGQRSFPIVPGESLDAFLRRSKAVAAELLLDVLADVRAGTVSRRPLDVTEGSYHSWPKRTDVQRLVAAGHRVW